MKEILKVGAVVVAGGALITLAAYKHKNVPAPVSQPSQAQLQLQVDTQRISNLEAQVTHLSALNTTQKVELCSYIQQHVNAKTTPLPTDCQ